MAFRVTDADVVRACTIPNRAVASKGSLVSYREERDRNLCLVKGKRGKFVETSLEYGGYAFYILHTLTGVKTTMRALAEEKANSFFKIQVLGTYILQEGQNSIPLGPYVFISNYKTKTVISENDHDKSCQTNICG